jgi:dTDP-4-dehydrorhamnose reductase
MNTTKILITGANGLLGQRLSKQLLEKGYIVTGIGKGECRFDNHNSIQFTYRDLDITDGPATESAILEEKPSLIVHAAAMTQVDQCEVDKQSCYNVNVTATRFIIDAGKQVEAKIIYVSTDFIFDGADGPYKEDAEPAPLNYYGSTKLIAEQVVMQSSLEWAIARTVLVYGDAPSTGRTNIIGFIKQSLEKNATIRMVTDQWRTPTFVDDLARGIVLMIEKNAKGVYNISGEEMMTPYDIAVETATYLGLNTSLIQQASSPEIRQPAIRPARTGFDITKAKKDLNYRPLSFRDGLRQIFS